MSGSRRRPETQNPGGQWLPPGCHKVTVSCYALAGNANSGIVIFDNTLPGKSGAWLRNYPKGHRVDGGLPMLQQCT
jgi:hypothetical protein